MSHVKYSTKTHPSSKITKVIIICSFEIQKDHHVKLLWHSAVHFAHLWRLHPQQNEHFERRASLLWRYTYPWESKRLHCPASLFPWSQSGACSILRLPTRSVPSPWRPGRAERGCSFKCENCQVTAPFLLHRALRGAAQTALWLPSRYINLTINWSKLEFVL